MALIARLAPWSPSASTFAPARHRWHPTRRSPRSGGIGVDYELVLLERDEAQNDPAYRALNPLGVVPTLVDGDLVLTESAAILLYLGDRYPEARLAPEERAEYYRWLVFMTNTLQTTMLRFFYPERYGGGEVEAVAEAEAQRHFDLIESHLEGREWLVGDHRSGADLFLFMLTRWGRQLDTPAWERPAASCPLPANVRAPRRAADVRGRGARAAGLGGLISLCIVGDPHTVAPGVME